MPKKSIIKQFNLEALIVTGNQHGIRYIQLSIVEKCSFNYETIFHHLSFILTEWLGAGMVIGTEQGADLHMVQMSLPPNAVSYSSVKLRLVLPFWYQLTWVVKDK